MIEMTKRPLRKLQILLRYYHRNNEDEETKKKSLHYNTNILIEK